MRRHKGMSLMVVLLIAATICFIWNNSLQGPADSSAQSTIVYEIVRPAIAFVIGEGRTTAYFIRKLAHFTEFGILGGELAVFALLRGKNGRQPVINCLFVGLSVAVLDETIQRFTKRGSQIQDVVLDFAGVLAGVLFIYVSSTIIQRIQGRTQAQDASREEPAEV